MANLRSLTVIQKSCVLKRLSLPTTCGSGSGRRVEPRFPDDFYRALEQFDAGEYFACHETLEAIWIPETRAFREVYQGIINVAVGCYHLTVRSNWNGAVRQLEKGIRRLRPWPEEMDGVQLGALADAAERLLNHLRELGHE